MAPEPIAQCTLQETGVSIFMFVSCHSKGLIRTGSSYPQFQLIIFHVWDRINIVDVVHLILGHWKWKLTSDLETDMYSFGHHARLLDWRIVIWYWILDYQKSDSSMYLWVLDSIIWHFRPRIDQNVPFVQLYFWQSLINVVGCDAQILHGLR